MVKDGLLIGISHNSRKTSLRIDNKHYVSTLLKTPLASKKKTLLAFQREAQTLTLSNDVGTLVPVGESDINITEHPIGFTHLTCTWHLHRTRYTTRVWSVLNHDMSGHLSLSGSNVTVEQGNRPSKRARRSSSTSLASPEHEQELEQRPTHVPARVSPAAVAKPLSPS